jgi:hypothetical protein
LGASPRRAREISSESGDGRRNCCCCCCCCRGGGSEILSVAGRAPHLQPSPELPRRSLPACRCLFRDERGRRHFLSFIAFLSQGDSRRAREGLGTGGKGHPPGEEQKKGECKKKGEEQPRGKIFKIILDDATFSTTVDLRGPVIKIKTSKKKKRKGNETTEHLLFLFRLNYRRAASAVSLWRVSSERFPFFGRRERERAGGITAAMRLAPREGKKTSSRTRDESGDWK